MEKGIVSWRRAGILKPYLRPVSLEIGITGSFEVEKAFP